MKKIKNSIVAFCSIAAVSIASIMCINAFNRQSSASSSSCVENNDKTMSMQHATNHMFSMQGLLQEPSLPYDILDNSKKHANDSLDNKPSHSENDEYWQTRLKSREKSMLSMPKKTYAPRRISFSSASHSHHDYVSSNSASGKKPATSGNSEDDDGQVTSRTIDHVDVDTRTEINSKNK